jgi:signal transduction histidine kinase
MRNDVRRLRSLEKRFIAEETKSVLRHDLRNKLASIRNAAFYLRRKVEASAPALWKEEKRVPEFFALIDGELTAAETILGAALAAPAKSEEYPAVELYEIVRAAVDTVDRDDIAIRIGGDPAPLVARGDRDELAVAILVLIESAIDAGAHAIAVDCSARDDGSSAIDVHADDGGGFVSDISLAPNIARRIAARFGGKLELAGSEQPKRRATMILATPPRGKEPF